MSRARWVMSKRAIAEWKAREARRRPHECRCRDCGKELRGARWSDDLQADIDKVLRAHNVTRAGRDLMSVLVRPLLRRGDPVEHTRAALARAIGCDPRTIQTQLKALEEIGALVIDRDGRDHIRRIRVPFQFLRRLAEGVLPAPRRARRVINRIPTSTAREKNTAPLESPHTPLQRQTDNRGTADRSTDRLGITAPAHRATERIAAPGIDDFRGPLSKLAPPGPS